MHKWSAVWPLRYITILHWHPSVSKDNEICTLGSLGICLVTAPAVTVEPDSWKTFHSSICCNYCKWRSCLSLWILGLLSALYLLFPLVLIWMPSLTAVLTLVTNTQISLCDPLFTFTYLFQMERFFFPCSSYSITTELEWPELELPGAFLSTCCGTRTPAGNNISG